MPKRNSSANNITKASTEEYVHTVDYSKYTRNKNKSSKQGGKKSNRLFTFFIIAIITFGGLLALGVFSPDQSPSDTVGTYNSQDWQTFDNGDGTYVLLYSSESCSCCHIYVDYLENNGYTVDFRPVTNLENVKEDLQVPEGLYSCHTAKIGGYVVEGHIPTVGITKLLEDRPNIDGITLPQMPAGSPGMSGQKAGPFEVQSFINGQSTGIYIEI